MKNIRQKVFETNSSSTHSISICNNTNGVYNTIEPNNLGVIIITCSEFGWGWEKSNDSMVKASYCLTDNINNINNIKMLHEVVKEHTGAKKVILDVNVSGYVDHQSVGASSDAFTTKETLKDFIFNSKSYLFIGNDNSSPPFNFYDDEDTVFSYKIYLEALPQFALKLEKYPSNLDELKEIINDFYYSDDIHSHLRHNLFASKEMIDVNNNKISSFSEIDNNIILFFDCESCYKDNHFVGYSIKNTYKYKFVIEKI